MKIRTLIDVGLLIGMIVFGGLFYKNVEDHPDQTLVAHCCEVQCEHEECSRQRELQQQCLKSICFGSVVVLMFLCIIVPKLDFSHCIIWVSFPMN